MWWIQSVYVRPEHRRLGFFKALYNRVKKEAVAANAGKLLLWMIPDQLSWHQTFMFTLMTELYIGR